MEKKNVILALGTGFYGEAVKEELRRSDEIDIVAEVSSPLELLHLTEVHEAVAVIMETDNESQMPGVLTHMFAEFPHLLAIVLDPEQNRSTIYRQQIREQVLDEVSLSEMLGELSHADSDYWMRA